MGDTRPSLDTSTEINQEVLNELAREFEEAVNEDSFAGKVARADETRLAVWDGQSDDGRKHEEDLEEPAFPFEGAADVRVRLADDICNHVVDLYMLAFTRGSLGIEGDAAKAEELGAIRKYIHYVVFSWLYTDILNELELHANNIVNYGWGVLHFLWDKRESLRPRRITLDLLAELPEFQNVENIAAALEEKKDMVKEFLRAQFELSAKDAKRIVKELIEDGATEVPVLDVVRDKPCVVALQPFRDILFPPDTADIQEARVIFRRQRMTESELRAIAEVDGWDPEWLEHTIKNTKGQVQIPDQLDVRTSDFDFFGDSTKDEKIEVVWAYHRAVKDGVTGIYLTVFSPHFQTIDEQNGPSFAISQLVTGADDKYPFRVFRREQLRRPVVESRGIPEIVKTWEHEIASQLNATIDRSTFDTFPPFEVPLEYGDQLKITPGSLLSTFNRGDLGFIDPHAVNHRMRST